VSLPIPQRTPTLGTVISNALSSRLLDVHTALPAKVEKYDPTTQTVDVKPTLKPYALAEGNVPEPRALPVITNVPLVFPGAGGFRITFPVKVGDVVLLVFSESSLEAWQSSDGQHDLAPGDFRRHNLSDAIAIPGLHTNAKPWTGASSSAMTLGKDGGPQVVARATGIELGGSDADVPLDAVSKGTKLEADLATLITAHQTLLAALSTFLGVIAPLTTSPGAAATALGTYVAAVTAFTGAVTGFTSGTAARLSTIVKTK
jgi:hypothetical protein